MEGTSYEELAKSSTLHCRLEKEGHVLINYTFKASPFCDITQCILVVTEVSGQPNCPIVKCQTVRK